MSLITFLKEAGQKLLHSGASAQGAETQQPEQQLASNRDKEQALERAILDYMAAQNLPIEDLTVLYESATATVTVSGAPPNHTTGEKIVLCWRNEQGSTNVKDQSKVVAGRGEKSKWDEVRRGNGKSTLPNSSPMS